jgi:deazaflavin-dependent oxidoreductase (nitroreductase family)
MAELPSDMRAYNRKMIEDFRANGGAGDRQLLLLTTRGRRSGEPRTTPMMYVRLDDRLYVIASNAGAPRDPDWYLNLAADPEVTVEIGSDEYAATAVPLRDGERDRVFDEICAAYPFFVEHQQRSGRQLPVVAVQPR